MIINSKKIFRGEEYPRLRLLKRFLKIKPKDNLIYPKIVNI